MLFRRQHYVLADRRRKAVSAGGVVVPLGSPALTRHVLGRTPEDGSAFRLFFKEATAGHRHPYGGSNFPCTSATLASPAREVSLAWVPGASAPAGRGRSGAPRAALLKPALLNDAKSSRRRCGGLRSPRRLLSRRRGVGRASAKDGTSAGSGPFRQASTAMAWGVARSWARRWATTWVTIGVTT